MYRTVSYICLQFYPEADYLTGNSLFFEYDPKVTQKCCCIPSVCVCVCAFHVFMSFVYGRKLSRLKTFVNFA